MLKVGWTKSAREELATLWLEADSALRTAITAATAQIDRLLENSPGDVGESRSENRRLAFVHPIGFVFAVDEARRRAKVLHV